MRMPLSKRIGFPDWSIEARADPGVMARSLMYLLAIGGLVALAALRGASTAATPRVAATAVLLWAMAAVLLAGYDALPQWLHSVFLAVTVALADWNVAYAGRTALAFLPLLVATAVYAFYFSSKRQAALQIVLVAGGFAAAAIAGGSITRPELLVAEAGIAATAGLVAFHRMSANRLIWRLTDVARTDPLTGLANRRAFEELIEMELERSRRSGNPLSLIVGDLDHFKRLNDNFGHGAGDNALERVSLILQTAKRRIDTAARIGGEEFAVILPESDQHAAFILAERMRREVRETFGPEAYDLTLSLGVATFPAHASTVEALVARADESLYAAKALGRDRTVVFYEELSNSVFEAVPAGHDPASRHLGTVLALARAFDDREAGRDTHSQTVGGYAAGIARALGLPAEVVERVRVGGIVHDIGKIGISDTVLEKRGWLTAEDWFELRRHPEIGAQILRRAELHDVSGWVRAHHERPDGTGYPAGLHSADIPLEARILAVADAYEAMTSDRVYRTAMTPEQARAELLSGAGTQFDKRVVDTFIDLLDARAGNLGPAPEEVTADGDGAVRLRSQSRHIDH